MPEVDSDTSSMDSCTAYFITFVRSNMGRQHIATATKSTSVKCRYYGNTFTVRVLFIDHGDIGLSQLVTIGPILRMIYQKHQ